MQVNRLVRGLVRLVRTLLLALVALWFLFEEFGWHPLAAWLGQFARWAPWARTEARIARIPPRPALLLFLLPALVLLPVKLLALSLLHNGRPWLGLAVIVSAKLLGTAVGGRLFILLKPQLMRLKRFARAMAWWRHLRSRVRRALRLSTSWRRMLVTLGRWRLWWRARFR